MNNICVAAIFFAGDDEEDRRFAQELAARIRLDRPTALLDVDELERQDLRGEDGPERSGLPVVVLSRRMLTNPNHRRKLADFAPKLGVEWRRAFYLCRGITVSEIRSGYPDLEPLVDSVTIGEEGEVEALVLEVHAYVRAWRKRPRRRLRLFWDLALIWLGHLWMIPAQLLPAVSLAAPLVLAYDMLMAPFMQATTVVLWACLGAFGTGYALNRIPALDFAPWLGRHWRVPFTESTDHMVRHFSASSSHHWAAIRQTTPFRPDSNEARCTEAELWRAIMSWLGATRRSAVLQLTKLGMLVVPPWAALWTFGPSTLLLGAGCAVLGLLIPTLESVIYLTVQRWNSQVRGLTERELARVGRSFASQAAPRMEIWALLPTLLNRHALRRWTLAPDRVFISYARSDEEHDPVASDLAAGLREQGIDCYQDKQNRWGKFVPWRAEVVNALLDCTHLFVVLGPHFSEGRVVQREIRMAVQRWNTEVLPAIVCVCEPAVAADLLATAELAAEVEFVLRWCPRLTPEEARDPAPVLWLVEQRRRQGRLRDWLTLLFPEWALDRMLETTWDHRLRRRYAAVEAAR